MTPQQTATTRKRILLTGMSGTGKSSVIVRLAELGYVAVDADTLTSSCSRLRQS